MPIPTEVTATARVQITVEVAVSQPWPASASVSEVHERAARETVEAIRALLGNSTIKIVGDPRVLVVIAEARK